MPNPQFPMPNPHSSTKGKIGKNKTTPTLTESNRWSDRTDDKTSDNLFHILNFGTCLHYY
ncbi:hypothetical protein NC990_10425 [Funiculus sociatus GB2-M1]